MYVVATYHKQLQREREICRAVVHATIVRYKNEKNEKKEETMVNSKNLMCCSCSSGKWVRSSMNLLKSVRCTSIPLLLLDFQTYRTNKNRNIPPSTRCFKMLILYQKSPLNF